MMCILSGGNMAKRTMKEIKEIAKARRDKYLAEFIARGCTITELADKYKISPVRMGQLIKIAKL